MSFAIVAGSVIGAAGSMYAADKQASASKKGMNASIAEQGRQYDQTRDDLEPWRNSGGEANARMDRAMSGDMSDFQTSPGYNFRRDEGMRDVGNNIAMRGGGGNAMKALTDWNQNMASEEFGNWWNRNAGMSDAGRGATNVTSQAGMNAANNNSQAYQQGYTNMGNARASGINGVNNAIQGGIGNAMYYGQNPSGFQSPQVQGGYDPTMGPPAVPAGLAPRNNERIF